MSYILDSGKLFSFGNNGEGQLGIGSTDGQNQRKPIQVEGMQSERIKMLSAGNEQSVALTGMGGCVVAWEYIYYVSAGICIVTSLDFDDLWVNVWVHVWVIVWVFMSFHLWMLMY